MLWQGSTAGAFDLRTIVLESIESNNGVFHRSLLFLPFVASEDSGLYTCLVNVSSGYSSSFIVNASMSRTNEYIIVGKSLCVFVNNVHVVCVRMSHNFLIKHYKITKKIITKIFDKSYYEQVINIIIMSI